jgi:hypothetical protein
MRHRVPHTRQRLFLALLPLLLMGSEAAHTLVERFAPASYEGRELGVPGAIVPLALAVLVAGVAAEAPRPQRRLPFWPAALLPLALFAVQEHVEYALGHGHLAWELAAQWPFLAGLALQLPFAAAAYLLARGLLRLARALLAATPAATPVAPPLVPLTAPPRAQALGAGRRPRGPPLRSSA